MKKEDAVPGKLVRIPDKDGHTGARQVMLNGGPSLAGVILGYGRYHLEHQGLCGEAIAVERRYADNCLVLLVQKPLGWQECNLHKDRVQARIAITPKTEWVLRTYPLQSVMDHEAWLVAGESSRLIDMEVQALRERYDTLSDEAVKLATPHVFFTHDTVTKAFHINGNTGKLGLRATWSTEDRDAWMPNAPAEVCTRLDEIEAEMQGIIKRLSCVR